MLYSNNFNKTASSGMYRIVLLSIISYTLEQDDIPLPESLFRVVVLDFIRTSDPLFITTIFSTC